MGFARVARKCRLSAPCSISRPDFMSATRSAISATTPISWVISRMATPNSLFSSRISSRIWAWTVTSSAVVGSSAISTLGRQDERHRDHHPLSHAAGELVRILVERAPARGCAQLEHAASARPRASVALLRRCSANGLGDLLADGHDRIERGHRLLEDHRDLAAAHAAASPARSSAQFAAGEPDRCRPRLQRQRQQPHDGERGQRLSRSGFAGQAQRLAGVDARSSRLRAPGASPRGVRASTDRPSTARMGFGVSIVTRRRCGESRRRRPSSA